MACKPAVHSLGSTASPGRAGRSVLASRKTSCCVRAWSKKGDTDGTNRRLHDKLLDFDKARNTKHGVQALIMSFYKYHCIRNGALLLVVPRFRQPFFRPDSISVSGGKLAPLASQSRHIMSGVWAVGWLRRPLGKLDSANCFVGA